MIADAETVAVGWRDRLTLGLRLIGFCVVFYAVPILLVCVVANRYWQHQERFQREGSWERLEKSFTVLQRALDSRRFFENLLHEFTDRVEASQDPRRTVRILQAHLRRRFPGAFSFTVTDAKGDPVWELCDGRPPRRMVRRLRELFLTHRRGQKISRSDQNVLRVMLGPLADATRIDSASLFNASYLNQKAFVYVKPTSKLFFVIHVTQIPGWETVGVADRIVAFNARARRIRLGIYDLEAPLASASAWFGVASAGMPLLSSRIDSSLNGFVWQEGRWWTQQQFKSTIRLLAAIRAPVAEEVVRGRRWLPLALSLLFGGLTVGSWKVAVGRWRLYLSIRLKLVLLFVFTAGLPLTVLFATAASYLVERRSVLETQRSREIELGLKQYDRAFEQQFGEMQRALRRLFDRRLLPGVQQTPSAIERLQTAMGLLKPKDAMLIDAHGKPAWRRDPNQSGKARVAERMFAGVAVNLCKSLNGEDADPTEVTQNALSETVGAVSNVDMDLMYSEFARNLGRIVEVSFGSGRVFQFTGPLYDARGRAAYLVFLTWAKNEAERIYVDRTVLRLGRKLGDSQVWAVCPTARNYSRPRRFDFAKICEPLAAKLEVESEVARERVATRAGVLLLTGIHGRHLNEFNLIAVTSDRSIRLELEQLRFWLLLAAGLMVLISVTVSHLLARSFLLPVQELAGGVDALRRREFSRRVPVLADDELGDLSSTFNQMMEGLADLEVARIVQESLFPSDALRAGRCSIYGTCQSASEVGGDYFDYFAMSEDRIAVLIGDVSGHGVGAAMVMSMAKAMVAHLSRESVSPAVVLDEMNRLLLEMLRRKKMMSCFLGFLDLGSLVLSAANAGHNFPYRCRAGRLDSLELNGFPLGTRAKSKYSVAQWELAPGDTVVLYTDGLVEAFDRRSGQPIGYIEFERVLPDLICDGARATEAAIRAWHRDVVRAGPQDDDISVIILQVDR